MHEAGTDLRVFEYLDYRKFLADHYQVKKARNRHYSHRLFSLKAGIKSTGYFSEVLSGRRKLSKSQVPKFAKGLELGDNERVYFELLVAFTHAKSGKAKQSLYESLIKAMPLQIQQLRRSQMEYFSKWYHVAVREALCLHKVRDDFEALSSLLHPTITPAQAKSAIRILENLKLIEKGPGGIWRARDVSLMSKGDESTALLLRAFQGEMIGKAREALDTVPPGQRDISCTTMSVSRDGLLRIKGLVKDFHKRILEVVQSDRNEDRVIQLNLQVFPLTQNEDEHAPKNA